MSEIIKLRPGKIDTIEDLFESARTNKVEKGFVVGITEDGTPFCEANNNITVAEMAWMSVVLTTIVHKLMEV